MDTRQLKVRTSVCAHQDDVTARMTYSDTPHTLLILSRLSAMGFGCRGDEAVTSGTLYRPVHA